MTLSAGDGGISLTGENLFVGERDEEFLAVATGPVSFGGTIDSAGQLTIASHDGAVNVSGATVSTRRVFGAGRRSGHILITSFAGPAGSIEARNASISTGDSDEESGSITLRVHEVSNNAPPPDTVRSFLLPKRVSLSLGGSKKPGLKVKAFFDTGPAEVDLRQATTLTVGTRTVDIPGLSSAGGGKEFTYSTDELKISVKPSKVGSSKARFLLSWSTDLTGVLDPDGAAAFRYEVGSADAKGTAVLSVGKFTFGRTRGELIEPEMDVRKAKARYGPPGAGRDGFLFVAGFPVANPPDTPPTVVIGFGDLYNVTIPPDYKPGSINRVLATLRHFSKFVHFQAPFLAGDPFAGVKDVSKEQPSWNGLTDREINLCKSAIDIRLASCKRNNQNPLFEAAIFYTLLHTGLRSFELTSLQLGQYHHRGFHDVQRKGDVTTNNETKSTEL